MMRPAFPFVRDVAGLTARRFDLVVIGGGIYGSWAALDAAQRGLSVALIEQNDWGSGTSQSSTKLIHGGLRYLEHFKLGLVHHALRERKLLARLAPHLVRPLDFRVPVFSHSRVGPFMLSCGLTLYDLMAGFGSPVSWHRYDRAAAIQRHFPFLAHERLLGAFRYGDCQEDDARMTLVVAAAAHSFGAVCANQVRATALQANADGWEVQIHADGHSQKIQSRAVINAAGPWAARLLGDQAPPVELVKGSHLIMPGIPGVRQAFLLTGDDGRVFFVVPWHGRSLVGTTEQTITRVEDAHATEDDIAYLLRSANAAMPGLGWTRNEVISTFSGTRTLQKADTDNLSAISREFAVLRPQAGLWVSVGGKYTTARCDAVGIIDQVVEHLSCSVPTQSDRHALPGTPKLPFTTWFGSARAQLLACGADAVASQACALRHGEQVSVLIKLIEANRSLAERIHPDAPFLKAEALYACTHEMATSDDDVYRRRMPLSLIAGPDWATGAGNVSELPSAAAAI